MMGLSPLERLRVQQLKNKPRPVAFRTFVNINPGHNKFWKIGTSDDYTVVTNYGVIDTDGTYQHKEFDYHYDTLIYIKNKINEKLRGGYVEIR